MKLPFLHTLLATAFVATCALGQSEFPQGNQGEPRGPGPGRPGDQGGFQQGPRGPGPGPNSGGMQQRGQFRRPDRMNEPFPGIRPPVVEPRVIVMNLGRLDAAEANRMDADLNVMLTILEKELDDLNGTRPMSAMGIPVSLQNRVGRHVALFLEDYGVLFRLFVAFPLSKDAGAIQPGQGRERGTVWEQTRRDLYRQNDPSNPQSEMVYSEDRINELRRALIAALKQSVNIRSLKPQDHVSVTVTSAMGRRLQPERKGGDEDILDAFSRLERGLPLESVGIDTLVISASHEDVLAAANGKITDEEFASRVRIRGSWEHPDGK